MREFINYFIKYPVAANLIMFGLLILGAIGMLSLKSTFFPEAPSRLITVQVIYPGASPQEVEEGVVNKIEDNLKGLTGVDRYSSISSENSGLVTVEIEEGYEADVVLQDVKNAVNRISSFPVGMEPAVISKIEPLGPVMSFALSGDVDLPTLKRYAREVEDDLRAMDGVSQIIVTGFPEEEIEIAFRERDLRAFNLTFQEASQAIREANIDLTGGTIKGDREDLLIRAKSKSYYTEGLRDIVVRTSPQGGVVRLHQIANINDQWTDKPNKSFLNGTPSVVITLMNTIEEDMLSIKADVAEYLTTFNERDIAIKSKIVSDNSIPLQQRLDTLIMNGIMGFVIVCILLAMFLHWRLAFWVALAIPVSFAGMYIFANMLGVTINVISLFGMILVIGILVDDGIVIGENIYSKYEQGVPRMQAAIEGTMQVLPAVFAAILTTIIAFSSFLFIEGTLGDFFGEMAIVVIFSLIFSLIEGVVILPTHVAHSHALSANRTPNKVQRWFEQRMNNLRDKIYAPALRFAMNYRHLTLAICVSVLMLTFGAVAGGFIKGTIFPNVEADDLTINLQLAAGTNEEITLEKLNYIAQSVWQANEKLTEDVFQNRKEAIRFVEVRLGPSSYQGQVKVAVLEGDFREDLGIIDVQKAIREEVGFIPEAEVFNFGNFGPFGKPVSVSLLGENYEELKAATDALSKELSQLTELADVGDNNQEGLKEITLTLKDKAEYLGISLQDIIGQVRQGFFGVEAQRLQRGEDEVKIWVRYAKSDRGSLTDLEQMRIRFPNNVAYPLSELAEISEERGVISINHIDGQQEIKVEADISAPDVSVSDVLTEIKEEIVPEILLNYPSVAASYEGQNREQMKSMVSMQRIMPIILGLMFFVIAIAFRSIGQTLVLFVLVPFGFIGVAWGHWLMGVQISLFSGLGIIALVGILVNDGLVFISSYNDYLREGDDQMEALYKTGIARFRPIVLTSITTFAGLAPLLFEQSLQAQFLIPMAISVSFGLLAVTVVLLILLPALLIMLNRFRVNISRLWNANNPEYKEVEPAYKEVN